MGQQKRSKWELDEPVVLVLAEAAYRKLVAFMQNLEPQLGPTGRLGHIGDWGGKLAGAAVRIAAHLHIASSPFTAPSTEIGAEPMAGAIAVAEYFIPHALAAFDLMGTDEGIDDARRVLAWIKEEHIEKFTARDAFQLFKGFFKKMTRMNEALKLLHDHQYVHELPSGKKGKPGRPPSPTFWVNPWIFEECLKTLRILSTPGSSESSQSPIDVIRVTREAPSSMQLRCA